MIRKGAQVSIMAGSATQRSTKGGIHDRNRIKAINSSRLAHETRSSLNSQLTAKPLKVATHRHQPRVSRVSALSPTPELVSSTARGFFLARRDPHPQKKNNSQTEPSPAKLGRVSRALS
jgi:hypothetical protein